MASNEQDGFYSFTEYCDAIWNNPEPDSRMPNASGPDPHPVYPNNPGHNVPVVAPQIFQSAPQQFNVPPMPMQHTLGYVSQGQDHAPPAQYAQNTPMQPSYITMQETAGQVMYIFFPAYTYIFTL
jgi:hypothetical protein